METAETTETPKNRRQLRERGIVIGALPTGRRNAITDVDGVRVGHTTCVEGGGPLQPGIGPVRTGVTVILPHADNLYRHKVRAAVHRINGFGKACGFEEVRELGVLESPIALTNTLNVWRVADALVDDALRQNPDIGIHTSTFNPVVGECNDGHLNDIQGRHITAADVHAALVAARSSEDGAPVAEGNVGAGTGTSCFGWKGGIGTASRVIPVEVGGWTLGALVQSNFGRPEQLVVNGDAVGRRLRPADVVNEGTSEEKGSIMIVLATDAPLGSRQLGRLCARVAAGLARTGSTIGHGSGDFVIAFSTATCIAHDPQTITRPETVLADEGRVLSYLFDAVVEAVEEAVLNSLCMAETMTGRDGHVRWGIERLTSAG
ncbi:MAG: P1 family peptidase [Caldilineaceae bacterium]